MLTGQSASKLSSIQQGGQRKGIHSKSPSKSRHVGEAANTLQPILDRTDALMPVHTAPSTIGEGDAEAFAGSSQHRDATDRWRTHPHRWLLPSKQETRLCGVHVLP
jgi:hypothetical protein